MNTAKAKDQTIGFWIKTFSVSDFNTYADYIEAIRKHANQPVAEPDFNKEFDLAFYALALAGEIGITQATRELEQLRLNTFNQSVQK